MLNNILKKEFINTQVDAKDWKDAIHKALIPLVENKMVEKRYEEAILNNFEKHGTYMVIAPGIVLSHARPEDGVIKEAIGVINLKRPVKFGHDTNDPVNLIITLAAKDNDSHLEALKKLMEVLMNQNNVRKLICAEDNITIEKILLQ